MIASPSFTGIYSYMANEFKRLRMRARGVYLLAQVLGRKNGLKSLAYNHSLDRGNKRYLGIQNIPIDSIIGTLGRNTDFDGNFRPLKNHLLDRWVNTYLRLDSDGWAPIVVHKLGDEYYVEDGHHRVSVAKFVGMMFIDAAVWDHSSLQMPQQYCLQRREMLRTPKGVCSTSS